MRELERHYAQGVNGANSIKKASRDSEVKSTGRYGF